MTTNSRLPSSQSFDHLVYLRVFEGCNLHCLHCFIPSNPKKMTAEQVKDAPRLLSSHIRSGSKILLQWHGGEPTLMGPSFISKSIEEIEKTGDQYTWAHGIQTNLMTFDEHWAEVYFKHFNAEVGISWDPKIRLLNKHSPDSNVAYERKFFSNLKKLKDAGLTPYVVVTATKSLFEAFPNPFAFLQMWADVGVNHVHLERITQTGNARQNWQTVGLTNAEYSGYMSRWYKAYKAYKQSNVGGIHLSPFENLADSLMSLQAGAPMPQGCWSGKCDTRFHTIDASGYKIGCTALTSESDNRNAFASLPLFNDLSKSRELRTFNCSACQYRKICSSGCLALSFDDGSGECSGGRALFDTISELAKVNPT